MSATLTVDHGAAEARRSPSTIVAVVNQKGGVGKTMMSLALAAHTGAAHGHALVVDVDPQASAHDLTAAMHAAGQDPGYDVVAETDPSQLSKLGELRSHDTIYVDCPGNLKDTDVLEEVLHHADFALIPYDHSPESISPTVRTMQLVIDEGVPYAVVITRAAGALGAAWIQDAWSTIEGAGGHHFRSFLRLYRAWPNSLRDGTPITRYRARNAGEMREDIARVHTELLLALRRKDA